MKIAAAYIRVSTDDQIEYSPDSQRKAILDYAKRNDYIVPQEYIFVDEGISGRSTKRPAFQQMIGTAKQKSHPFDAILVWKFSRFARNREDSVVYKSMLRKQCGVEVVSISEQIGEDKTSILIEALLEAMDEYYSINLSEEVVRGMSEKARRGGTLGRAPFGYTAKDGALLPNDDAKTVQWIFNAFLSGTGMRTIATQLNNNGIRTAYGKPWENRTVEYVLRNITYAGHQHWTPGGTKDMKHAEKIKGNTIVKNNAHTAIVSEEQFAAVQEKIAENKRKYKKHEQPEVGIPFLGKGLLRCSDCGGALCMLGRGNGIQCHNYAHGKCNVSHYIKLEYIDKMIVDKIKSDVEAQNFRTILIPENAAESQEMQDNKRALERARKKLARVREAYENGIDTIEEYRQNKARIQKEIEELEAKPAPPKETQESAAEKLRQRILSNVTLLESDAPAGLKNDMLHTFVSRIVFDRKNTRVEVEYHG